MSKSLLEICGCHRGQVIVLLLLAASGCGKQDTVVGPTAPIPEHRKESEVTEIDLSHDETLAWIHDHRAWQKASKTQPMWARAVTEGEIGKQFQTADRATEVAREGLWLCVGVANEPWFQKPDSIEAKYEPGEVVTKQFAFDDVPHDYSLFRPKPGVMNWVARVEGPGIAGFNIRPGFDPQVTLHSKAGGYVVKSDSADPYSDTSSDVWLVQEPLFESTYELLPDRPDPGSTVRQPGN
ncbi:MAG: hypothetical protein JSS49_28580 [Planctomycetes bacterium]|nr:hypothetical protein [Planctomycetota bacterium]